MFPPFYPWQNGAGLESLLFPMISAADVGVPQSFGVMLLCLRAAALPSWIPAKGESLCSQASPESNVCPLGLVVLVSLGPWACGVDSPQQGPGGPDSNKGARWKNELYSACLIQFILTCSHFFP